MDIIDIASKLTGGDKEKAAEFVDKLRDIFKSYGVDPEKEADEEDIKNLFSNIEFISDLTKLISEYGGENINITNFNRDVFSSESANKQNIIVGRIFQIMKIVGIEPSSFKAWMIYGRLLEVEDPILEDLYTEWETISNNLKDDDYKKKYKYRFSALCGDSKNPELIAKYHTSDSINPQNICGPKYLSVLSGEEINKKFLEEFKNDIVDEENEYIDIKVLKNIPVDCVKKPFNFERYQRFCIGGTSDTAIICRAFSNSDKEFLIPQFFAIYADNVDENKVSYRIYVPVFGNLYDTETGNPLVISDLIPPVVAQNVHEVFHLTDYVNRSFGYEKQMSMFDICSAIRKYEYDEEKNKFSVYLNRIGEFVETPYEHLASNNKNKIYLGKVKITHKDDYLIDRFLHAIGKDNCTELPLFVKLDVRDDHPLIRYYAGNFVYQKALKENNAAINTQELFLDEEGLYFNDYF